MDRTFWDQRYSDQAYAYGKEPNVFLREQIDRLRVGRALDLAAGEGRNAVFLAARGMDVLAVDQSQVGLDKASRLAADHGLALRTCQADLADFGADPGSADTIVMCFMHLPSPLRTAVYQRAADWLSPGGTLLLECYRPEQLALDTGGPKDPGLLPTLDELRGAFKTLDMLIAREAVRDIHEGMYHSGESHVIQVLGTKPV